jgi:hypothetical protein
MRTAAPAVLAVLVGVSLTGCSSTPSARTAPGCDLVPRSRVVGLLGKDVDAHTTGTVTALREKRRALACRNTVPGHRERYVTVEADYHPKPMRLPTKSCGAGWVYAGTPEKFTPACQDAVEGHGRTQLIVRWQPYVMHVTISRSDRNWGGDPEVALAMSRALAQRLGVKEARGDG